MKKIIDVEHLIKRYKKSESNAVDDVSFYVEEGAFFSLLGPNGAGKTTTLSILNTTLTKTSGTISIAGHSLDTHAANIRENIGVIFQNPSLDMNLTAEENVRIHVNLYGLYPFRPAYSLMPQGYKKKVKELSDVLQISNDMFKPVKTFSGGMKRKLEIIRSLTHNPRVLFLDEPTTGLDPISRKGLWDYLQDVRKRENITIFLTTHYLEEAEKSDYICVMNKGKIVSKGSPEEIKNSLIDAFITVDAKDRETLKKELEKRKLKISGGGPYKIDMGKKTAYEIITSISTPLTDIQVHTPTLEEAYVEIINNA